ncbi:hypothetical protein ENTCAN_06974 [Enterobacter cancerogenus ATCC 35316]|nr:hypothetical protein ENTCAN_06974 [Enterobacter cancerogenus ATCC 35316]
MQHSSHKNRPLPAARAIPYKQSIIKFHNYNNFVTFKQYLKVATVPAQLFHLQFPRITYYSTKA